MAYKVLGHPRITIGADIGASVISLKELILTTLETNKVALFGAGDPDAAKYEFLRHIGSWNCIEGSIGHGSSAEVESIYVLTDFREKNSDGTGDYPAAVDVEAHGVELAPDSVRHYLYHADLDRILIYCTNAAVRVNIDVAMEI